MSECDCKALIMRRLGSLGAVVPWVGVRGEVE